MKFFFDPATHTYTVDGIIVPSVTGIIADTIPRNYSCADWYLERGSAMHKAIHLLIQDKLDWATVDERISRRILAYEKFRRDSGFKPFATERAMPCQRYRFAGTIDALYPSAKGRKNEVVLCDFKSSLEKQLEIQIGGYSVLLRENGYECNTGFGLELKDNGTYRCRWFKASEMRIAEQNFLACLTVRNWMHKNGVMKA